MAEPAVRGRPFPLSVIICTYRREETLRLLLEDLLAQEGSEPEIIVVDQTPKHAPETDALLAREARRIRHLRIAEPNLPNARNQGIAAANGELAVFIDDDLRVPPRFLRDLAAFFTDPEIEGIAPLVVVDGEEPQGAYTEFHYGFRGDWRAQRLIRVDRVIGACMALRLARVRELGGFDALMGRLNPSATGEDYEFCGRWVRAGHRLWLVPSVRAIHLGNTPGGCDVRQLPNDEAKRQAQRGMTFLVLKEERSFERMAPRAWWRILRSTVLRRDVLAQGPSAWLLAWRRMLATLADVRAFWREHGASRDELQHT
jgi:hypothetical protein